MSKKYGVDDKTRFLVLYLDAEMSGPDIAKLLNRAGSTVRRWISITKKGKDIRAETRGPKKSISEETQNKITQMVIEDPEGATLKRLAARVGHSHSTIQKILAKKGFKYKAFDQSVVYEEDERMLRVDFCNRMLADDGRLIYRTFFSDEMGIELKRVHKNRAWQLATEKLRKKNAAENIKVDCWAAISAQGATSLEIYKKGMNGDLYRQIIESHKTEMEMLYPDGEFYFIQDIHPVHRMNEEWIVKEMKLGLIKLPRKSPDLNIIEHVWVALKERVRIDDPATESELRASLLKNWAVLTHPERMQPFFEGLHRRYYECVSRNGEKLGH